MRIAIDATAACTPRPTGIGRYTAQLARSLFDLDVDISLGTRFSHLRYHRHRLEVGDCARFWIQQPWWPPLMNPDVIHVTDSRVPRWRAPRVATLHDVMHLVPELLGQEPISTASFRDRMIEGYHSIARDCHRIIAVSETTRHDFLSNVDCPAEKVVTVHHGLDPVFFPMPPDESEKILASRGIPREAILYVGDLSLRKNIPGIIRGFLAADLGDVPLVLAGESTFGGEELQSFIEKEGKGRIHHVGWLGDDVLPALYSSARALLYCSFYEGFGMPILEAMGCGCPVVIADRGAAPEIAGGFAEMCQPEDPLSMSQALLRALSQQDSNRTAAREHAASFSWQRCASETLEVYRAAREVAGAEHDQSHPTTSLEKIR
ncbi:MAG: glycosyltransferase family 1 protein [Planctomycetota bacterium]|nr:glycosyltransferase family 1 protein [Planctomycetota bacterium]